MVYRHARLKDGTELASAEIAAMPWNGSCHTSKVLETTAQLP